MAMFLGGKSTALEVRALMDAFPASAGLRVSHQAAAEACGVDVASGRFLSVTHRWRKTVERDHRIRVVSEDKHFVFLTADEAHDHGRKDMHRIGRAAGKMVARIAVIDPNELSTERRDRHHLLAREAQAMLEHARTSAKAIAAPKAVSATVHPLQRGKS